MKFCKSCGRELNDDTIFCPACGTQAGTSAAPGGHPGSNFQGAPYEAPPVSPVNFYQGGAPNNAQGPYFMGSQYGGVPNNPNGGSGNNKALKIVIAAIIAVILIGGGIFAIIKLTNKSDTSLSDNKPHTSSQSSPAVSPKPPASASAKPTPSASPKPSASASASAKPSLSPSVKPTPSASPKPSPSAEPSSSSNSGADALSSFDAAAVKNIQAAFKEIGLDVALIKNLDYYGGWFSGSVYSFTYKNSVIDMFMYDDGKVFSIETNAVQVYLDNYESYKLSDYLGAKTHYDEVQPMTGYVFYNNGGTMDSTIHFKVADNYNYVIELISEGDNLVSAFFVSKDQPLAMVVPAGTYQMRYAVGDKWLGVADLFGSDTQYFAADDTITVSAKKEITYPLDITGGEAASFTEIGSSEF